MQLIEFFKYHSFIMYSDFAVAETVDCEQKLVVFDHELNCVDKLKRDINGFHWDALNGYMLAEKGWPHLFLGHLIYQLT